MVHSIVHNYRKQVLLFNTMFTFYSYVAIVEMQWYP